MLLFGNETVTLIKHIKGDEDTYTCHTIDGASWFAKTSISTSGDGAKPSNSYTVRLPSVPVVPDEGDYMARGVVTDVPKPSDLAAVEHFRITAVGANNRGNLSHWRVDGQ